METVAGGRKMVLGVVGGAQQWDKYSRKTEKKHGIVMRSSPQEAALQIQPPSPPWSASQKDSQKNSHPRWRR